MTSPKELQELSNGLSDEDYNRLRFRNDDENNDEEKTLGYWLDDDNYNAHLDKFDDGTDY